MATLRKVCTLPIGFNSKDQSIEVKVYRDSEVNEYVVRLYVNDEHYEPADYYTDAKDDAIATARSMLADNVSK